VAVPESFVPIASQQGVVPFMQDMARPFDSNYARCLTIYVVSNPYILNLSYRSILGYLVYATRISNISPTVAGNWRLEKPRPASLGISSLY
jgi:hypothetical protein